MVELWSLKTTLPPQRKKKTQKIGEKKKEQCKPEQQQQQQQKNFCMLALQITRLFTVFYVVLDGSILQDQLDSTLALFFCVKSSLF